MISLLERFFKKEAYSDTNASRMVLAVFTGLSLATAIIGVLFRMEILPGAEVMLKVGSWSLIILAVFFAVPYFKDSKITFYRKNLIRVLFFTFVSIAFMLTSSKSIMKIRYSEHPEYVKAYEQLLENPSDTTLHDKLEVERNRIWNEK